MFVIIGPYWLTAQHSASGLRRLDDLGDWVRREVEAGLSRPEAAVIPVLTDGATMPGADDLPASLRSLCDRNAFVLTGKNFPEEVDALIEGIRRGQLSPLRRAGPGQPLTDVHDVRSARRRRALDTVSGALQIIGRSADWAGTFPL
jgi:hypothetical protein